LRTRAHTAAALPDAMGEGPLAWLGEFLREDSAREGQAAAASRSELLGASEGRQPAAIARRWPLVVALSGLDGAGKSSQAAALMDLLSWLGLETEVFWLPLGHSGLQRTVRRVLRQLRGLPRPSRDLAATGVGAEVSRVRRGGGGGRVGTAVWAIFVAVIYAVSYQRVVSRLRHRSQVIIFDRYVTDAAAQVRYFYGANRQFRFARWLLRRLSPSAGCAYLLDLEPGAALARKQDQYDLQQLSLQAELLRSQARAFGVTILDAESARDEITARIAEDIWRAVTV
jgi:thymidylate kinase